MADTSAPASPPDAPPLSRPYRVRDLDQSTRTEFDIEPGPDELAGMAVHLGANSVRKFLFSGAVTNNGDTGFTLEGQLGATLSLTCVVSLKTFNLRIDTPVRRVFVPNDTSETPPNEIALAEDFDADVEDLGSIIDPGEIALEELALCVPAYPRAPEAALEKADFAAPGVTPLSDATSKPFAALAALKSKSQDQ